MSTTILWHTSSGAAGRVDDSSRNVGGLVEAGAGEGRQVINWVLTIGIGWLILMVIATLTMCATVALKSGAHELSLVMVSEIPTIIGLASPGLILVLTAVLRGAVAGRRVRSRGIDDER